MDLGLRGKRAVITGASRGIGRAIAEALAQEGCDLLIAARDGALLSDVAQSLSDKHKVEVRPFAADLSESAGQKALVDAAGDIDILVNNAGGIPSGGIAKVDEDAWRQGWDLKVFGYINIIRAVYPKMVARGKGVIVNVIGEAGLNPFADYIAGASGNAALIAVNNALGLASFKKGVRVVAVNPAATLTDRIETIWRRRAAAEFGDAEQWRKYGENHPFGRPAEAREVADVVAFVASDRGSYLSGMGITMGATPAFKASEEP